MPFDDVMLCYRKAHILALPSQTEGWPKVLAEAMCYGVVCVSMAHGIIPALLEGRGRVVSADGAEALAAAIVDVVSDPAEYLRLSRAGADWARKYSLEGLRDALGQLLSERWPMSPLATAQVHE